MAIDKALAAQIARVTGVADSRLWGLTRWSYWDYVRLPVTGTNELNHFVIPQGATDPVSALPKSVEQTNVPQNRQFGANLVIIRRISTHVHVLPCARQSAAGNQAVASLINSARVADLNGINDLLRQGVFQFIVNEKILFEVPQPFLKMPPAFGVNVETHQAAAAAGSMYVSQEPNQANVFNVSPAVIISNNTTFYSKILFPNANTPTLADSLSVDIGVILDGYVIRARL